jgi:hypothetical protein
MSLAMTRACRQRNEPQATIYCMWHGSGPGVVRAGGCCAGLSYLGRPLALGSHVMCTPRIETVMTSLRGAVAVPSNNFRIGCG